VTTDTVVVDELIGEKPPRQHGKTKASFELTFYSQKAYDFSMPRILKKRKNWVITATDPINSGQDRGMTVIVTAIHTCHNKGNHWHDFGRLIDKAVTTRFRVPRERHGDVTWAPDPNCPDHHPTCMHPRRVL